MENARGVRSAARPALMWPFGYGERIKKDRWEIRGLGAREIVNN